MPHSLVLNLLPRSPIPETHLSGRHLHALFLDLVRSLDPVLSTELHQQQVEKSFTLSPLQIASRRETSGYKTALLQWQRDRFIPAGTPCWWRISLLDDRLFGKLTRLWIHLQASQAWQLGGAELQLVSVLGTPQPSQIWANFATYADIFQQASEQERRIHFQFCTPTAFRQASYDCALPTKQLIFQSLVRRWNQYSNLPIAEEVLDPLYPSFFDIRTEVVVDSRSKFIGCVGEITFQILGEVEPSTIRQINALADYAFYAGVGRKTPMGMGIVRRYRSESNI